MATYLDGNVRKATANTVTAMIRSAEKRRCPKCQRKSALVSISDEFGIGSACRWAEQNKCDYAWFKFFDEISTPTPGAE